MRHKEDLNVTVDTMCCLLPLMSWQTFLDTCPCTIFPYSRVKKGERENNETCALCLVCYISNNEFSLHENLGPKGYASMERRIFSREGKAQNIFSSQMK